jgi:hypothetical protein
MDPRFTVVVPTFNEEPWREATGRCLVFLDDEDRVEPQRLEVLGAQLGRGAAAIARAVHDATLRNALGAEARRHAVEQLGLHEGRISGSRGRSAAGCSPSRAPASSTTRPTPTRRRRGAAWCR